MISTSKDLVTCKNELQDVLGDMTKTYETEEKSNIFFTASSDGKKVGYFLSLTYLLNIPFMDGLLGSMSSVG